jgi:hypothetical protein
MQVKNAAPDMTGRNLTKIRGPGKKSYSSLSTGRNIPTGWDGRAVKQGNEEIAAAFRESLKAVAGFSFVPDPLPMRSSTNAVVYYLIFVSQKPVAEKTISHIFKKPR